MKILATGNPSYGVAQALNERVPGIDWLSRASGWEISSIQSIDRVVGKSMDCDIFLNNSKLDFFHQTLLAQRMACYWIKKEKKGRIINIGSSADSTLEQKGPYPAEKIALRHYTRQIHHQWREKRHDVRMTYISVGNVETPTNPDFENPLILKLKAEEVADLIVYALNIPAHANLEEIRYEARRL
jgi:NADP-dependent 3-hydroxy acid dehydrogenase YdfG